MWRSCKRYPSFNSSLRFYQANSGPVCFSVGFDFERKKQVNPAKLLAFHARCPAAGHGISGSYNVQPQNREKRAPSRLTLMRTALFWYAVPNKASEPRIDQNTVHQLHARAYINLTCLRFWGWGGSALRLAPPI